MVLNVKSLDFDEDAVIGIADALTAGIDRFGLLCGQCLKNYFHKNTYSRKSGQKSPWDANHRQEVAIAYLRKGWVYEGTPICPRCKKSGANREY